MISSLAWIPAGVSDPNPKKYQLSETELELLQQMQTARLQEEEAVDNNDNDEEDGNHSTPAKPPHSDTCISIGDNDKNQSDLPADLRMDEYSDDDDNEEEEEQDEHAKEGRALGNLLVSDADLEHEMMIQCPPETDESDDDNDNQQDDLRDVPDTREFEPLNVAGLTSMGISAADPFGNDNQDELSELQDTQLTHDDAVMVLSKTEDDFCSLEVHVYDTLTANLYVHHDIPLPSFPLCVCHGQVVNNDIGNFCAVGTFEPHIELWNLDIINVLEPSTILQQHSDAVLCMDWNTTHKQVLASGSADTTIVLWDVSTSSASSTLSHHSNKVQSMHWNPAEATLLASAGYDQRLCVADARSTQSKFVPLSADSEAVQWDPHTTHNLSVVCEDGTISTYDVRKFETPIYTYQNESKRGITDLHYSPHIPHLYATSHVDQTVTLWKNNQPIINKNMCVGKLYNVQWYPSKPWLLGCAGSGNMLAVWDLSSEDKIVNACQAPIVVQDDATAGTAATMNDPTTDLTTNGLDDSIEQTENGEDGKDATRNVSQKKKKQRGKNKKKAHKKRR